MLPESLLHADFDSFLCMDEFLIVHVFNAGKEKGFGLKNWQQHFQGSALDMCIKPQML